ncbi:MAG: hypothetical protein WBO45_04015 [Planctomycetota bacterium]
MRSPSVEAPSQFPRWVALGCLVFVLWLFFGNTVPALRDQQALAGHAEHLRSLKADYDAAIQEARLGAGPNAHHDLQALLVAIDQKDLTPRELCMLWPERSPRAASGRGDPASEPSPASPVSR